MKKKANSITNVKDAIIQITSEIQSRDAINLVIDKIGPKAALHIILGQCLMNTLEKTSFPSSFFANKKDEEMADVTAVLYYLKHNWKEASDKGMKMLEEKIKKAQEK